MGTRIRTVNKIGKGKSGGAGKALGGKTEGQKPIRFEKSHDLTEI